MEETISQKKGIKFPLGNLPTLIMTAFLFLKAVNFYSFIGSGKYVFPFAFLTTFITLLIPVIISIFSVKASKAVFAVLYTVLSVFMCIDLVYFRYANKMPAFGLLKMSWQVEGVSGMFDSLLTFRNVGLTIGDLPLWIVWLIAKKVIEKRRGAKFSFSGKLYRSAECIVSLVCVIALVIGIFFCSLNLSAFKNEIVLYHARDAKNLFFPDNSGTVDRDKYSQGLDSADENGLMGLCRGRNLIIVQVEALQDFVIGTEYLGEDMTPNINKIISTDSFYFENYYYQIGGGNTADAEFTVNNSLFAPENEAAYVRYETGKDFYGLPFVLKDNGYSTATVFHAYREDYWNRNKAYPAQGFDDFVSLEDFVQDEPRAMGISDRSMFRQSVEMMKDFKQPFYSFIITLSTHHPYALPPEERYIDQGNRDPNLFQLYMMSIKYYDTVFGEFIEELKEAGLYDNSVIVMYGDHYALSNADEKERAGVESLIGDYNMFERFSVPLIIHIPGLGYAETKDTVGGHIDVMPTVLYLLGIENQKGVMFGHNLLEKDYEGTVYEQTHMASGSFITKDVVFYNHEGEINQKVYVKKGSNASDNPEDYGDTVAKAKETIEDCRLLIEQNNIRKK